MRPAYAISRWTWASSWSLFSPREEAFLNLLAAACCPVSLFWEEFEGGRPFEGFDIDRFLNRDWDDCIPWVVRLPASSRVILPVLFKVSPINNLFFETCLKLFYEFRSIIPVALSIFVGPVKFIPELEFLFYVDASYAICMSCPVLVICLVESVLFWP